eukprot:scpid23902/ scgid17679/ 
MAAVIAAQLADAIAATLKLSQTQVILWSDSMNVLHWVRSRSRAFKTFVANRVSQIHSLTSPDAWRYVPTDSNPADIAPRGAAATVLVDSSLWWNGPEFLQLEQEHWPVTSFAEPATEQQERSKRATDEPLTAIRTLFVNASTTDDDIGDRLTATRYSSWSRYQRVMAYVLRFLSNCRQPTANRQIGALTVDDLHDAEVYILKAAQAESFPVEVAALSKVHAVAPKCKLAPLTPIMDDDGLLRCRGRLDEAESLLFDTRHPVILPRDAHVTKLIVAHHHVNNKHCAGVNHLWSELAARYWIIGGREAIRDCRVHGVPAEECQA